MTTISERLRYMAHDYWFGPPADERLEWKAADTVDALVAALEEASKAILNCDRMGNHELYGVIEKIDAALAKAKGKSK